MTSAGNSLSANPSPSASAAPLSARGRAAVAAGKSAARLIRSLGRGAGTTMPGEVALRVEPTLLRQLAAQIRYGVILVAGTNGKTTTTKMLAQLLEQQGYRVITNASGANLVSGLTTSLLLSASASGRLDYDFGLFEVDEATLPHVLRAVEPRALLLLNLFRDQLDRYGEVNLLAALWAKSLSTLPPETVLVINADDPTIAGLGIGVAARTFTFGLGDRSLLHHEMEHTADSIYCPACDAPLEFEGIYYSHLGVWRCPNCGLQEPTLDMDSEGVDFPLPGIYNRYNTLAALAAARALGVGGTNPDKALRSFKPAFGRLEEVTIPGPDGKTYPARIILAKNPTGFNQSLRLLSEFPGRKVVLLALNDLTPDGTDVSWIWDIDFEHLVGQANALVISGLRAYDMAVRVKYAGWDVTRNPTYVTENLGDAINTAITYLAPGQELFILPTYSAMLDIRGLIRGERIL
ncbi:MAG: MurT ligase domain-containing protein [Anaerolineae bacterium]